MMSPLQDGLNNVKSNTVPCQYLVSTANEARKPHEQFKNSSVSLSGKKPQPKGLNSEQKILER